jgi:hypothetical protein
MRRWKNLSFTGTGVDWDWAGLGSPIKGRVNKKTPLLKEKFDSFSFDTSYDTITKALFLFRSAPATSNDDSRGL